MLTYCAVTQATAAFLIPNDPSLPFQWNRPTTLLESYQRGSSYDEWDVFSSTEGPNAPDVGAISWDEQFLGPANMLDAASDISGSFITGGGNIYSSEGVVRPRAIVPLDAGIDGSFGINVLLQVRTLGQDIDTADLKWNGHLVSSLPNYSYRELARTALGGFGGNLVDHAWTFTAWEGYASFDFDWGWGVTSASVDRVSVDIKKLPGLGSNNGDFTDDGAVNDQDINVLWHLLRGTGSDPNNNDTADLNNDGVANEDDLDFMLSNKLTYGTNRRYGDADLLGGVGPDDFTAWRAGGSGWAHGDFDGTGDVGPDDFTLWRTAPTHYPFNVGPRLGDALAVPEPTSVMIAVIGVLGLCTGWRCVARRPIR